LINFIALLGWNAGTEQEIYTLNELINQFTLDNVHKAGAVFDLEKLDWINGMYIRKMSSDEFYESCVPYLINANILTLSKGKVVVNSTGEKVAPAYVKDILSLEQPRVKKLTDIVEAVGFFFANELTYDAKNLIWRKSDKATTLTNLQALEKILLKVKKDDFTKENLKQIITDFLEKNGLDTGSVLWPMRYALSGRDHSPDPYEIAGALGKDKSLTRITTAIAKLG